MEDLRYLSRGAIVCATKVGRPRRDASNGISGTIDLLISMFAVSPANVRRTGDRHSMSPNKIRGNVYTRRILVYSTY